jgi:hypothetical protein
MDAGADDTTHAAVERGSRQTSAAPSTVEVQSHQTHITWLAGHVGRKSIFLSRAH